MSRMITVEATVANVVEEAISELLDLLDEMENRNQTSVEHVWDSRTYWRIKNAAEKLPYYSSELQVPDDLQELKVRYRVHISPRGRPERRENAVLRLRAVANLLAGRQHSEHGSFKEDLAHVIKEAEDAEFPAQRQAAASAPLRGVGRKIPPCYLPGEAGRKPGSAMSDEALLNRITAAPEIFGGKPVVRGMRISVELILSLLAQGESYEAVLEDYPELELDDIRACLAYARAALADETLEAVRVAPLEIPG